MIDRVMTVHEQILKMAERANHLARTVSALDTTTKNGVLHAIADTIDRQREIIKAANATDMHHGSSRGLSSAMLDRLRLDDGRIDAMVEGILQIARLPDPVGCVLDTRRHGNGMTIEKVRVPLGVVLIIYESRPNVTADAAALCFKAGNAVILRGGSEALQSNAAIAEAMRSVLQDNNLEPDIMQLVGTTDRSAVHDLLQLDEYIDLVIPRGGENLIRAVAEHSKVPVLKHYKGVCHVYVDRDADPDMARNIAINAKCQRPGVCNAMETLLVHRDIASQFIPSVGQALFDNGVAIRGDATTCALLSQARPATEDDWFEEYLDLILAVRVVDDLPSAIDHIETYGSHHSDVIVTNDETTAQQFARAVDSAAVYINASSRFTDGGEFGLGAEIGISTDKLHARGPCGLEELTTYKYIVRGNGQVRT